MSRGRRAAGWAIFALDVKGHLTLDSLPPHSGMRLISKILWFLAFIAATFCWMVLFEHGFTMKGFSKGVREEWNSLMTLVSGPKKP